ncbi:flagellar basal body rod protein FlgB [Gorillibacterium massiliense]|uniref:flagellar basal body rod protein FlgB n=1 Tax=Gorillibacterium massiliense TaxID=1280390 RepID=UPI0004B088AE|nr:flagellar basal body rod protein FlgB [Gorillibacterium massiliense]
MEILNNPSFRLLEGSLNAANLRQTVIANNIANVDTPNFKRSDVRFEELLQSEMSGSNTLAGRRSDPRHFSFGTSSGLTPKIETDEQSIMNNNKNNVDIDSEMALSAKNQLRYNVMIELANNEIRHLRTSIDKGR